MREPARRRLRVVIGLAVSGLFLWLAFHRVDGGELAAAMTSARPGPLLAAAGISFVMLFVRGLRWYFFLKGVRRLPVIPLGWSVAVGFAVNNTIGARLGDLVRSISAARKGSLAVTTVIGTVAVERLWDALSLLALMGIGLAIGDLGRPLDELSSAVRSGLGVELDRSAVPVSLVAVVAVVLILIVAARLWTGRIVRLVGVALLPLPGRWRDAAGRAVAGFATGLRQTADPAELITISLLSLVLWIASGAVIWLSLGACGITSGAVDALFVLLALAIAVAIPAGPGAIGTYHYLAASAISLATGSSWSQATAAATLLHLANYVPRTGAGIYAVVRERLWLADASSADGAERRSGPPAEPAAGRPELSVVVPLYRCADTVGELVRRLRDTLDGAGLAHEIILVDDASGDDTLAAALAAAGSPAVGVVALATNVGQHRAIAEGLRRSRGVLTVVMDGDLQDPPEAVPELVRRASDGIAAVFAIRRGRHQHWSRRLTSRLYKTLLAGITGVPAGAGAFVLMRRDLVDDVLRLPGPLVSLGAAIGLTGRPLAGVPVVRQARTTGGSSYSGPARLRLGLRVLGYVLRYRLLGPPADGGRREPVDATCYGMPVTGGRRPVVS